MSHVNVSGPFIEIFGHHGLNVDIIEKWKIKQLVKKINKKAKPIIGIHFHEQCCLNDGQIMKYHTRQCTSIQTGWTHRCKACNSKLVYMNIKFQNNLCIDGTLKSSDHPNSDICGIFINFEVPYQLFCWLIRYYCCRIERIVWRICDKTIQYLLSWW